MSKLELKIFVSLLGLPNNLLETDHSTKNPKFLQFMGINRQRKREFQAPPKHQMSEKEKKQFNLLTTLYYKYNSALKKERVELLYYYSNADMRRGLFWQKVEHVVSKAKHIPLSPKHSISSRYESLDFILFHNFDPNFLETKYDPEKFGQTFNYDRIRNLIPDKEQYREELFSFLMLWEKAYQNLNAWDQLDLDTQHHTINVIFAISVITTNPAFMLEAIKIVPELEKEYAIVLELNPIMTNDFETKEKIFLSELDVWLVKQKESDEKAVDSEENIFEAEETVEPFDECNSSIEDSSDESIHFEVSDDEEHEQLNPDDVFGKLQELSQRAMSADGIDPVLLNNAHRLSNLLEKYLNNLDELKAKCRDLLNILLQFFTNYAKKEQILWLNETFITLIEDYLSKRIVEININNHLIYFKGQLGDMIKYSELIVDLISRNIDEFNQCQLKVQDIVSNQLISASFGERQSILSQLEDHYGHMHNLTKIQNNLEQDLHCLIFNFSHFDEDRYKSNMSADEFQEKFGGVRETLTRSTAENLITSQLPKSLIEHLPKTSKRLIDAVISNATKAQPIQPTTVKAKTELVVELPQEPKVQIEKVEEYVIESVVQETIDQQEFVEESFIIESNNKEIDNFNYEIGDEETIETHLKTTIENEDVSEEVDNVDYQNKICDLYTLSSDLKDNQDNFSSENINQLAHDMRENSENAQLMNALIWQLVIKKRREHDYILGYHLTSAWENSCIENSVENTLLLPPALLRAMSLKPYISSYYDEVAIQFKKSIEDLLPIEDNNLILNLMILGTIAKPALLYPDSGLHEYLSEIHIKSRYIYAFTQIIQNFSTKHYPLSVELISQIANYLYNKQCMQHMEEYVVIHNDLDLVTPNFSYVPAGKILKYWKNKDQIIDELLRPMKNRDYSIKTLEELKQKCARLKIHSVVEKHINETFKIIQETKNEPLLAESNQKLHLGLNNIINEVEKWADFYLDEHQNQWKYNQSFIETEHLINDLQQIHQPLIQEFEQFKSNDNSYLNDAVEFCINSINDIINLFNININEKQLYASTPTYAYQDILNNILLKTTLWLNAQDKSINYALNHPEDVLQSLVRLIEVDLNDYDFDWTDIFRSRNSMGDHQMTLKTIEYLKSIGASQSLVSSLEIKRMKDVKEWSSELLNTLKKHQNDLNILRQKIQSLNNNMLISELEDLEEEILLYVETIEGFFNNYNQPIDFNDYKELIFQVAEKIGQINIQLEDLSNEKKS